MKKSILILTGILLFTSCSCDENYNKNVWHHGWFFHSLLDTIKVTDSTYVVNVVYYNRQSGDISAVKLCVINK